MYIFGSFLSAPQREKRSGPELLSQYVNMIHFWIIEWRTIIIIISYMIQMKIYYTMDI